MNGWLIPDVAKALGVSIKTVHRLVERGELVPTGYLNRRPWFSQDYVEQVARMREGCHRCPACGHVDVSRVQS